MTKPDYFFVSYDGALHDTRRTDWSAKPLRDHFEWTYGEIKSGRQLRATLRAGEWAWPGGYPLFFICSDGGALHFDCVRANLRYVLADIRDGGHWCQWRVMACEVNWEDGELYCEQCSKRIQSAYADDDQGVA